ncbi:copper chaperone PCu(A)C [Thioalkalivibrio sp. ALJ24]|uniref:copper chaperone PCu(A)C n=1 Tax=Thioalkalivibrio sp. ALJ24 TaxID=545276 RepID=UPI00035C84B8|nr:copper chaperone PCu(A)C [Thioalkalivibrio sp. ALJ24]
MKPTLQSFLPGRTALVGLVWLALATAGAQAGDREHDADGSYACDCPEGLEIVSEPWVRMMPPGMGSTAAYLTLANRTDEDIDLVRGESPVAGVTELHDHVQDDAGVMRMREVEAITIPAGGETALEPGGLHVMLIDLHAPLERAQRVSVTLETDAGDTMEFEARVRDAETDGMGHGHGGGHHGH